MILAAKIEKMTGDDFLVWDEQQPDKNEFIGGEVFAMVGVTRQHATVAGNLFVFLSQQLRGSPCRVYMAEMRLRLEVADSFFYPDVFVTCSESDHQTDRYMSQPRLIVEVLSESTEAYDRGAKFEKCRLFSTLAEYVLINPAKRKVESFRRDATGHWVLYEFGEDDVVDIASLELTLSASVLYENV